MQHYDKRMNGINSDVKAYALKNLVPQWRIAQALGISESLLIRTLRTELSEENRKQIISAIDGIVERRLSDG